MSTSADLTDLLHAEALRRVPLQGGIGLVEREGPAVFVSGGQPHGLLGRFSPATCVRLLCTDDAVSATILGGRGGIAVDKPLFTRAVAGQPLQAVAVEVVDTVSTYLAASTG